MNMLFALCLMFIAEPSGINRTWIFRGEAHGVKAVGYLTMYDGKQPFGELWFAGAVNGSVRLAGLNPPAAKGWHESEQGGTWTLMFAPVAPWRLGEVAWNGDRGVIDFLDVQFDHGEIPVSVEVR